MLYELVRRRLLVVVPVVPFLHPRLAKIASARSDDIEAQYGSSSSFRLVKSKIMSLPDNVLLSIMELLPVKDMVCFSMVNRRLNKLAQTPSIWISQACTHLALSCPLIIPPKILYVLTNHHFFRRPVLHKATRSTVLITSHISHKWTRPYATPVAQPCPRWLRILRENSYYKIIHIATSYALLLREDVDMGHGAHELIRWDLGEDRGKRLALGGALLSLRKERLMRTVHCVVGGYPAANASGNFEIRIMRVHIHGPSPGRSPPTLSATASNIIAADNLAGLAGNPLPMKEILACFTMPFSSKIDVRILDVPLRAVAVLFEFRKVPRGRVLRSGKKKAKVLDEITPTSTLGLGIVFDWKTRLSVVLDTGIPFDFCNTSAALQLGPNLSHLIIRTEANVYNESTGFNSRVARTNCIDLIRLKEHASSWEEATRLAFESVPETTVADSSAEPVRLTLENDTDMQSQSTHEYEWTDDSVHALSGDGLVPPLVSGPSSMLGTICSHLHHHLHSIPHPDPSSAVMHPLRLEDSQIARQYIFHQDWAAFRDNRSDVISKHPLVQCEDVTPSRLSMATLYSVPSAQIGAGADRIWYLSQSYVDASVEAASALVTAGSGSYVNLTVPPPIIVPIRNPLLVERTGGLNHDSRVRLQPLLHVSFNYACWVEALIEDDVPPAPIPAEQVIKVAMRTCPLAFVATVKLQASWAFRWRGQRRNPGIWFLKAVIQNKVHKLKLVSFRGPEGARLRSSLGSGLRPKRTELARAKAKDRESVEVVQNVTTLEVSPEVVRNALYLWLDEMEGTATVVSREGKLHAFSFA